MVGKGRGLAINGKFLAGLRTGVYRVGDRLTREMGRHADEIGRMFGGVPEMLAPRTAPRGADYGLRYRNASVLTGQSWEQIELPARLGRQPLLSFCNLAPIAHANAITMIHDAQTFSSPASYSPAFGAFYRTIQPLIGRRHRRILTVSHYSAEQLVRYGVAPAEKIRVVHNGVDHIDEVVADAAILARLGLRERGYVLALASVQPHKNIEVLLKAFVAPSLPDVQLVLFGGCDRREMAAAGLVVPAGVTFTGRISDGEIRALMEAALCFAMPSLTEGFGLPPLEAMQLGCPAIVAPCGALPEVCGEAALQAAATEPAAWTTAIRALADDRSFREDRVAAGRRQAARFGWRAAGDTVMMVLREIAAEDREKAARRGGGRDPAPAARSHPAEAGTSGQIRPSSRRISHQPPSDMASNRPRRIQRG